MQTSGSGCGSRSRRCRRCTRQVLARTRSLPPPPPLAFSALFFTATSNERRANVVGRRSQTRVRSDALCARAPLTGAARPLAVQQPPRHSDRTLCARAAAKRSAHSQPSTTESKVRASLGMGTVRATSAGDHFGGRPRAGGVAGLEGARGATRRVRDSPSTTLFAVQSWRNSPAKTSAPARAPMRAAALASFASL